MEPTITRQTREGTRWAMLDFEDHNWGYPVCGSADAPAGKLY